jgi:hypothetical protein
MMNYITIITYPLLEAWGEEMGKVVFAYMVLVGLFLWGHACFICWFLGHGEM